MDLSHLSTLIDEDRAAAAKALDAALTQKHGTGDPQGMLALHHLAIKFWRDDPHQVAFHRTHAYVYALEAGRWDDVDQLYEALHADGRI